MIAVFLMRLSSQMLSLDFSNLHAHDSREQNLMGCEKFSPMDMISNATETIFR
jgi:hypothetical protein